MCFNLVKLYYTKLWEIKPRPCPQIEFFSSRGQESLSFCMVQQQSFNIVCVFANIRWINKKQESSRETSLSALLTMSKPLTVWITIKCEKFWKGWEYQSTRPASWDSYMHIRKQQLELDMEQQTGSKSRKEYVKAAYCHPAYLTYIRSASCKMPGRMKHKLESRLPGEISITSDMQMTPPWWQKVKKN